MTKTLMEVRMAVKTLLDVEMMCVCDISSLDQFEKERKIFIISGIVNVRMGIRQLLASCSGVTLKSGYTNT